jgi:transposase
MMGRKYREQANFFYEFRLDDMIPKRHLLRRINVFVTSVLGDLHQQLGPFYSAIGRPSIDPELLIRMLIVGYCFGIRSERKLCEEVKLHLAYRWFCRLDLNDAMATFVAEKPMDRKLFADIEETHGHEEKFALDERDGDTTKKRQAEYNKLSELASHATFRGFQLTMRGGVCRTRAVRREDKPNGVARRDGTAGLGRRP